MYRNKKILIDCEILKSEILQTCPKPVGEWVKNVYEKRDRPISLIAIQEDNFDKRTNINIEQTQPTLASDINSNNQPQTQPTLPQTQQTLASDINSNNQPQIQFLPLLTFENNNNQLSDLMNEAETFSFRNRIQISPSAIAFETISEIQQDNEIPFEIDIADTM